jgi:hypothetical protein
MIQTSRRALVAALAALSLFPAAAMAGRPGAWTPAFPATPNDTTAAPWPLRLGDGSLLVAQRLAGDLAVATILPGGTIAPAAPIASGWPTLSDPALVGDPSGVRAFFGGLHSTDSGDPNSGQNTAFAPGPGGPWTVAPAAIDAGQPSQTDAFASPQSAALMADGTPLQTWASTLGVFVHRGLYPGGEIDLQSALGGCCGYDPQVAVDSVSGIPTVAWYSNATGHEGLWRSSLDPVTGAPTSAPSKVPSDTDQRGRVALTACPGRRGVALAERFGEPSARRVVVWNSSAERTATISHGDGEVRNVAIACGPDGRLWVAWTRNEDGMHLYVARSDSSRSTFGAPVELDAPKGSNDSFALAASAQPGRLDVLASWGEDSGSRTWHAQVLPALRVIAKPVTVAQGSRPRLRMVVTDAGRPVPGAVVHVGGHHATTNAEGVAVVRLGPAPRTRTLTLTASARGYTSGETTDRVKVRR